MTPRRDAEIAFVGAFVLGLLFGFLIGVGVAKGAEPLTVPQARAAFLRAEPHGHFHGCARRSPAALVCLVDVREIATNEWQDPATGEWEVTGRAVYWQRARVPIRADGIGWDEARGVRLAG